MISSGYRNRAGHSAPRRLSLVISAQKVAKGRAPQRLHVRGVRQQLPLSELLPYQYLEKPRIGSSTLLVSGLLGQARLSGG